MVSLLETFTIIGKFHKFYSGSSPFSLACWFVYRSANEVHGLAMDVEEKYLQDTLVNGDYSVFWDLWSRYRRNLYHVCLKMMRGSTDEAEDALGSAMIKAFDKLPEHAANLENFKGWVFQLTQNHCIDLIRKRKREVLYGNDFDYVVSSGNPVSNLECKSPENLFLDEEKIRLIHEAICRLPTRLRNPKLLHFFLQMDYRDIAFRLGISYENVRKRIQQARECLQQELVPRHPNFLHYLKSQCGVENSSKAWLMASRNAAAILEQDFREIESRFRASFVLMICLSSGLERSVLVFFKRKPIRIEVKIKTLKAYVERYPGGWKKRIELAELLVAGGIWDQAVEYYCQVLTKRPQLVETGLRVAEIYMFMEKNEKAIDILEGIVSYAHKDATTCHIKGLLGMCRMRFGQAITEFKQAVQLEPGNGAHQQKLAMCYVHEGRTQEALRSFDAALTYDPHDLVCLINSYDSLVLAGQLDGAVDRVQQALEIYPDDLYSLKRMAEHYCRTGVESDKNRSKVREIISRMKRQSGHTASVYEARAQYYFYRGAVNKMLDLLEDFALKRVNHPEAWHCLADWLYRCGEYREAARSVLESCHLDENNPGICKAACKILPEAGLKEPLKAFINKILERFSHRWDICIEAGHALVEALHEPEWGCRISAEAVRLQPGLPAAYFLHSRVLVCAGKHSEAAGVLTQGWDLLPPDRFNAYAAEAAWLMGCCHEKLSDPGQAEPWFHRTIASAARLKSYIPADAFYWEAKALAALKQDEKAANAFQQALDKGLFYPRRWEAKQKLKKYRGLPNERNIRFQWENSHNTITWR